MSEISFWNDNHPLSPMADQLLVKFLPLSGPTKYVESEIVRACNRIHHDCFNNGFGNNMSQPIAYIEKYHLPKASTAFREAFASIRQAAMEPWTYDRNLVNQFNTILAEVYTNLYEADSAKTLTPLIEEVFSMPFVEINSFEDEESFYDEDF